VTFTAPGAAVLHALALQAGLAAPSAPAGPWTALAIGGASPAQAAQGSHAATPPAHGRGPLPQAPDLGASSGSASAGGSGVAFSLLLALLFSIAAFALQHYSRLRLPPARPRPLAFVAVIERPG
jgi:hypothetical protein